MSSIKIMSRPQAVKAWVNHGATDPVENAEFMKFWRECSEEDKKSFAEVSVEELSRATGEGHQLKAA